MKPFMTISGSFGSIKVGQSDTAAKGMTTGLQGTWAFRMSVKTSL